MVVAIAAGLGIGSGIDTGALVRDLAANARALRATQILSKEARNSARISAVATLASDLRTLATNFSDSADGVADADLKKLARAFVAGFNGMRVSMTDAMRAGTATVPAGALSGDASARAVASELNRLPQALLVGAGAVQSLSDLGIGVTRDGTLTIDEARFDAALADHPADVRAALAAPAGLRAALRALADRVSAPDGPLGVAKARYERVATSIARARERMEADNAKLTERLTRSFSGMDRQVARLRAVQSYVEQQVAAWNKK